MYTRRRAHRTDDRARCHSDAILAISVSRDNGTAWAHYIIDSNSLPTYYIVTFLLRWTHHFPRRNGCFIMFKEPFTGPTWTLLTFIRQAERRICRNSGLCIRVMRDLTAFNCAPSPAVHNSPDFDAAPLTSSVTHCATDSTAALAAGCGSQRRRSRQVLSFV